MRSEWDSYLAELEADMGDVLVEVHRETGERRSAEGQSLTEFWSEQCEHAWDACREIDRAYAWWRRFGVSVTVLLVATLAVFGYCCAVWGS